MLCLDGGGIKGLVLTQQLFVLEKALGRPIQDCFDWICGTSTGGFLALMLSTGRSVKDVQTLYYSLKEKVFLGSRPYDSGPLEEILRKEFGEEATMSSIKGIKVMVTSTLADRLPPDLHLFRNYESPMNVIGLPESTHFSSQLPPHQQKIWLAARSSGAAPTYFSSLDQFVDGGMIANNPTLDVLTEIEEWNMAVRSKGRHEDLFVPTVVVSLGCGKAPLAKVENIDVVVPSLLDMRRGLQAVYNLFNLLVDSACPSQGRVVDRARAWCSALNVPFIRLNPQLSADISLDESSDEKLLRIMWETRAEMQRNSKMVEHLKYLLIPPPAEDGDSMKSACDTPFDTNNFSHGIQPPETDVPASSSDTSETDAPPLGNQESSKSNVNCDKSSETDTKNGKKAETTDHDNISASRETDASAGHIDVPASTCLDRGLHLRKGSDISIGFQELPGSAQNSERDDGGGSLSLQEGLEPTSSLIPQLSVPNLVELLTRSGVDPSVLASSMPDVLNSLNKCHSELSDSLQISPNRGASSSNDSNSSSNVTRSPSRSRFPYPISDPPGYPYLVNDKGPNENEFLPFNPLNPIVSTDTDASRLLDENRATSVMGLGFCPDSPISIRSLRLSEDISASGTADAVVDSAADAVVDSAAPKIAAAQASPSDSPALVAATAATAEAISEPVIDDEEQLPSYNWAVKNA